MNGTFLHFSFVSHKVVIQVPFSQKHETVPPTLLYDIYCNKQNTANNHEQFPIQDDEFGQVVFLWNRSNQLRLQ